jgi:putative drug exporter of the RND superfamily
VPRDARALRTQRAAEAAFGFPLLSRTLLVQRAPRALSAGQRAQVLATAARATAGAVPGLAYALPVLTPPGPAAPASTVAVTYLFFGRELSGAARERAVERYAGSLREATGVAAEPTGAIPARREAGSIISGRLPWLEMASLALVALVIGLAFRSVVAPVLALAAATIAYLVAVRVVAWMGRAVDLPPPAELEPLIVVLLLGVVADYSVFLLSGTRRRLGEGADADTATRRTLGEFGPTIAVAGITVAAGTAALLVARLEFVRALGPGLALSVLVGLAVALTLIPALLGLLGPRAFWPREAGPKRPGGERVRRLVTRVATIRPVATGVAVLCLAGLGAGAWGLHRAALGFNLVSGLPADSPPHRAADEIAAAFPRGAIAPTEVVVRSPRVPLPQGAVARLDGLLRRQPHVAAVIGAGDVPAGLRLGLLATRDGTAARSLVVLDVDPYGHRGIEAARSLRRDLPALARRAGLGDGVRLGVAGDSALAAETVSTMMGDLVRVAGVVLALDFVILAIFLRALVAPLVLLAFSGLSVLAAIGITSWVVGAFENAAELTYYVPFAAAVLLISMGSDYNVFLVGRVAGETRRASVRAAVRAAAPPAGRAITVAGVALASSFALLAIVPIQSFRAFALTMSAGILIDTFIVRSLLVPAGLALLGRAAGWPGHRLRPAEPGTPRPAGRAREGH